MIEDVKKTKGNKFEFNTYCIFTQEKQSIKETMGLIFKDYISNSLISGSETSGQKMPHTSYSNHK